MIININKKIKKTNKILNYTDNNIVTYLIYFMYTHKIHTDIGG